MKNIENVNVLGTTYTIKIVPREDDDNLDSGDGYCDSSIKEIIVEDMKPEKYSKKNLEEYTKQVIRHELIHAFLNESGLASNSPWACDEEMIDFFAIQFPKMIRTMKSVNAL